MKTRNQKRQNQTAALAILGAAAILLAPITMHPALAQGPQGGFGGPGGGGQGGFNRRPPFAYGTVTAVDAGAGTITISGRGGGPDQVIQTQGTTQIVSQIAASVSDLKKGDTIQVQGVPTGITASSVSIGQSPLSGLGGPGGGPGGPLPGGGPVPVIINTGSNGPAATAYATGTVTATSPLTISLSSTASLTLKMDPNAKVTKYTTTTLSAIKVGDRVLGIGTANDDGSFAATTVALNMDMGAMGGFGRGFGVRRGGNFNRPGPGGGQGGYNGGGQGGYNGGGQGGYNGGGQGGFGGPGAPPPPGQ